MIALCVNLAREIGLRPVERSLHVVLEWLGVEVEIPSYQTIRLWMQRIGLDRMQHARKTAGGAWLTDLWHLDHPESRSRKDVTESRMLEKLGWLRDFAPSIQQWQVCQEVVCTALTFINKKGIFRARRSSSRISSHTSRLIP